MERVLYLTKNFHLFHLLGPHGSEVDEDGRVLTGDGMRLRIGYTTELDGPGVRLDGDTARIDLAIVDFLEFGPPDRDAGSRVGCKLEHWDELPALLPRRKGHDDPDVPGSVFVQPAFEGLDPRATSSLLLLGDEPQQLLERVRSIRPVLDLNRDLPLDGLLNFVGEVVGDPAGIDRFAGPETKHAFARLWWTVELFRNGPDYEPAVKAFRYQDVPNNLFRMNIAHHRPTVQGAIATLFPAGEPLPQLGDKANALAKAANAAVTTLQLDLLAPDETLDEAAAKEWIDAAGDVDAVAACGDLPAGPDDPEAPEASVTRMTALLTALLAEAPLRERTKKVAVAEPHEDGDHHESDAGAEEQELVIG